MVQPVSILAARHGEAIRQHVHDQANLTGLWVGRDRVFDAAVQVCGLVLRCGAPQPATEVARAVGADFVPAKPLDRQPEPHDWGRAAATTVGIPDVHIQRSKQTVADLASATAGFRDQFYGFVPFVSEAEPAETVAAGEQAKLVTVGMIDVLGLSWGTRTFKYAKQSVQRPVVDLEQLQAQDPTLAQWAQARLRPKLLMATQTRVVEVWVDESGTSLPVTPVLSIEPLDDDPNTLWLLAAALSAPAVSAHILAAKFGTAMSLNALKLAARDVLVIPLPTNRKAWQNAADHLRGDQVDLDVFANQMGRAYGDPSEDLAQWWRTRVEPARNS